MFFRINRNREKFYIKNEIEIAVEEKGIAKGRLNTSRLAFN